MMPNLKDDSKLQQSSIVANSLMNRERVLSGSNSYEKELSFEVLDFLKQRLAKHKKVNWLDICCGSGKALIEATQNFNSQNVEIIGVDLAGMFDEIPPSLNCIKFIETSFEKFQTEKEFDLITCVHGLHYIGDKLKFIQKAISTLKPNGIFLSNLDPANFKSKNEKPLGREVVKSLRKNNLEYNSRKHLLTCKGKKEFDLDFEYLGANDEAGANYTKQNVVDSYYN